MVRAIAPPGTARARVRGLPDTAQAPALAHPVMGRAPARARREAVTTGPVPARPVVADMAVGMAGGARRAVAATADRFRAFAPNGRREGVNGLGVPGAPHAPDALGMLMTPNSAAPERGPQKTLKM